MNYSSITKIELGTTDINFNATGADTLLIDPLACTGMDQLPARTPVYVKAATDGANVFPFLKDARPIVLAGIVLIVSSSTEAGYVTARETLIASTITLLDGMLTTAGVLTWPSNTLSVYSTGGASFPGGFQKRFLIPLLALT